MAACKPSVRIQAADFDMKVEIDRMTNGRSDIGAIVTFSGLCRDEGGKLAALELEHYPGMAEAQIVSIAEQAYARWPVSDVLVVHRVGKIAVGGNIVLVICASPHREAAFLAASYLMDFLKTRAPFWKKEHLANGETGAWVDAKENDSNALQRWH